MCRGRTCCSAGRMYHHRDLAGPGRRLHLPKQHLWGVSPSLTHSQFFNSCIPVFHSVSCLLFLPFSACTTCHLSALLSVPSGTDLAREARVIKGYGQLTCTSLTAPSYELHLLFCPPYKDQIVHSHKQLRIFQSAWQAALMVPSHLDNCANGFCVSLY